MKFVETETAKAIVKVGYKTIATQLEDLKPIDWGAELKRAMDGVATDEDLDRMVRLSSQWITCACGNLCDVIPRDDKGTPLDGQLTDLGYEFYSRIKDGEYFEALCYLQKIEERSKQILTEIYGQQKEEE